MVLSQLLEIPCDNLSLSLSVHTLLCGVPHFYFIYKTKNTCLCFQGHCILLQVNLYVSFTTLLSKKKEVFLAQR